VGRLVHEDSRPGARTAVDADVVDGSAGTRLQDGAFDRDGEQVVLARLDLVEVFGGQGLAPVGLQLAREPLQAAEPWLVEALATLLVNIDQARVEQDPQVL
jgi:hypothetical protein